MKERGDPEIRLRRYWEAPDTPIVTAGLSALSVGYRAALAVREAAYGVRLLHTGRLGCPVKAKPSGPSSSECRRIKDEDQESERK